MSLCFFAHTHICTCWRLTNTLQSFRERIRSWVMSWPTWIDSGDSTPHIAIRWSTPCSQSIHHPDDPLVHAKTKLHYRQLIQMIRWMHSNDVSCWIMRLTRFEAYQVNLDQTRTHDPSKFALIVLVFVPWPTHTHPNVTKRDVSKRWVAWYILTKTKSVWYVDM